MRVDRSGFASCARSSTCWRATVTSARETPAAAVGVLGGTFNPPHNGHLACALGALRGLALDRVLLVPAGRAPHKHVDDPGAEHRFAMCRLAVEPHRGLDVSRLELDREGLSYTIDTLRALDECNEVERITLIVGADMAMSLRDWREPEALVALAELAVAPRGADDRTELGAALAPLGAAARVHHLPMTPVAVSSSEIRTRVARREPLEGLVPEAVAGYIRDNELYRKAAP